MVNKKSLRTPKYYDGVRPTGKQIRHLLPEVLAEIGEGFAERPDLVLAAWPEIIGGKLAPMTQAVSFSEGLLTVKVKNSTLLSLLSQHERPKLLKSLQQKFPSITIKGIVFRIG